MHVLLTRNLEDSKNLIQKFKSNGFKVSNLPLVEIIKLNYDEVKIWFKRNRPDRRPFICRRKTTMVRIIIRLSIYRSRNEKWLCI